MRSMRLAFVVVVAACGFSAELVSEQPDAMRSGEGPDAGSGSGSGPGSGSGSGSATCTPAVRATSTAASGSGTSIDVQKPAGTTAGDVLVAALLYESDGDEPVGTISSPAGWTQVQRNTHGGNGSIGQTIYVKVAAANEPATHRFTTGPSKRFIAVMHAYSGVDTASPVVMQVGSHDGASTTIATPAMTVPPCSMVVAAFGTQSIATVTPPGPLTERHELANNSGATITLATADGIMGGATGMLSAMASQSGLTIGQAIALRPAP